MNRHGSFWLGVFCALLIAMPISVGIIFSLFMRVGDVATFSFGILISLLLSFFLITVFRDKIFSKLFGTAKINVENVSIAAANIIGSAIKGNPKGVEENSEEFARLTIAWYAWVSLYRWVIATGVALLGTFAIFSGTIVIVEQNRKLQESNNKLQDSNDIAKTNTKLDRTFEAINMFVTDQRLTSSRDIIVEYMLKGDIPSNIISIEKDAKVIYNYIESISLQANGGHLDVRLLQETVGSVIIPIFDASKDFMKEMRCNNNASTAEIRTRGRKILENFEIFTLCHLKPYFEYQDVSEFDFDICQGRVQNKIMGIHYCD